MKLIDLSSKKMSAPVLEHFLRLVETDGNQSLLVNLGGLGDEPVLMSKDLTKEILENSLRDLD